MKAKRYFLVFGLALTLAAFCGCQTASEKTSAWQLVPPIAQGQSRIWFYRPGTFFGKGITPVVEINYETVGEVELGKALYVDRPPGNYVVEYKVHGMRAGKDYMELAAGMTRYVRLKQAQPFMKEGVRKIGEEKGMKELHTCEPVKGR
jgi:hypothetical protein